MGHERHRITVDDKGRLPIPDAVRAQNGIEPGYAYMLEADESGALLFTPAENPFDILAEHAISEYRAGRTRSLREIAAEEGIDLDSE